MKAMKRIVFGFVGVIVLLFLLAVTIPFFINVDQYRPQILKIANDNINGKLVIEKLSLSLWGQVKVTIDGLQVDDPAGASIVKVQQAYLHIPFGAIFSGKPQVTLRLDHPDIHVVKDAKGAMNVLSLMKTGSGGESAAPTTSSGNEGGGTSGDFKNSKLYPLVFNAHADIAIEGGNLVYQDQTLALNQELKDLNVLLQDISMSRPMKLAVWTDVGTKFGPNIQVKGPFRLDGEVAPHFDGVAFKDVHGDLTVNLDPMEVSVAGVLQKAPQMPANLHVIADISPAQVNVSTLNLKFHNAEINGKFVLRDLEGTGDLPAKPKMLMDVSSNAISLDSWDRLILPLQGYALQGSMAVKAHAEGPFETLAYQADLNLKDFSAAVPGLPIKPVFQAHVGVVTDEVKELKVDMAAPENNLSLKGSLKNFKAPQIVLNIESSGINLDKILPPSPEADKAPSAGKGGEAGAPPTAVAEKKPGPDVDGMLEVLKTNETLKALDGKLSIDIKRFQGFKIQAQNIRVDLGIKDLAARLEKLGVDVFKGHIGLDAAVDLKPKRPVYQVNLDVHELEMAEAVASQFESFRNTILGRLSFKAAGKGESLNPDLILANLDLKGQLGIKDATFATIDVAKMARDGVLKSAQKIEEKLKVVGFKMPGLQEPPGKAIKYKIISSDFTLLAGRFTAPNFKAESYPKAGLDLQGATELGLLDDSLSAEWYVVDTNNWLGLNEFNVKEQGVEIKKIFAEKGQPVRLPVKVGCKLSEPCFDYGAIPEHLGKVAMANVDQQFLKGAKNKAKEEVQKKIDEARKELDSKKKELEEKIRIQEEEQKRIAQQKLEEEKKKAKDQVKKQAGEKLKENLKGKLPF